ncbi:PfaD family polyunsaturated fatty acid/polyketide biosynthesis protein [Nocardia sp. NPDC051052]|uniref:PfaD family polyunsaturated fatty acid/polyketide biosynthesis protein n=1 Tax=Nocardia sp. NPDC051052 TaxID=3364322 RepID=UPI00379D85C2
MVREPLHIIGQKSAGALGLALYGEIQSQSDEDGYPLVGILPPIYPEWLGDRSFCATHGMRFPYIAGEMANGIATTRMVSAMARAEMLGFFGAAGLGLPALERAVSELKGELGARPNWGVNLIHAPGSPELEERVADLLLRYGVTRISASAFMQLTPALIRCSAAGLHLDSSGRIVRGVHLFAKVSRPEIAELFMSPAPGELLHALVNRGLLTEAEAQLAAQVPVAETVTVEADSGGHTDNRPLVGVLPAILALRDTLSRRFGYDRPIHVGAAGGLGTPAAVAAAFALGAAYVLTGSINQMAVESGVSEDAKSLLAEADIADVTMSPSADMFELGVRVQVLRRGTLFAAHAARLFETYRAYTGLDAITDEVRTKLEHNVLHASLEQIWEQTQSFWLERDPHQIVRAEADPKHRMALVFRWYLGMSSRWAIEGDLARRRDYQLWCGPAAGAFNRWVAGSFLAEPAQRSVVQIARNLLEGAAVSTRAHQLRTYGIALPAAAFTFTPRRLS